VFHSGKRDGRGDSRVVAGRKRERRKEEEKREERGSLGINFE